MKLNLETVGTVAHTGISKENEKNLYSNGLYVKSDECKSSARKAVKVKEESRKYNCLRAIVNSSISSVNKEVYKKSIKMGIKKYLFLCSFCVKKLGTIERSEKRSILNARRKVIKDKRQDIKYYNS